MAGKTTMKPWSPPDRGHFGFVGQWFEQTKQGPLVVWPSKTVDLPVRNRERLRHETWIAERLRYAATVLRDSIDIDPEKRGSVPVVRGTRVAVATILAELAEDATLSGIADDLDLDFTVLRKILQGIAIHLDRPFLR